MGSVQVLFVEQGLAIIEGLNNDAPVGCALAFVSGGTGALLWRRSDNICFALLLGGGSAVEVGEGVECKVKAILQVGRLPSHSWPEAAAFMAAKA